jgi:hypothetical protein
VHRRQREVPDVPDPDVERQLEGDGPVDRAATALAGWARYLGSSIRPARRSTPRATRPRDMPPTPCRSRAFLGYEAVFTPAVRASSRFRTAFAEATGASPSTARWRRWRRVRRANREHT